MNKLEKIVFWLCLILSITIVIIIKPLGNLDEMWNFNVSRCIADGLIPYKDISMVSTPLLGFLLAIPLKIFGSQLIISRISAIIMSVIVFVLASKIFNKLEIKNEISRLILLLLFVCIYDFLALNYNLLVLIFLLAIILLEVKQQKILKCNKGIVDFFIGILAGLSVCSKQSVGLIICFFVVICPICCIKNKRNIRNCFKKILFRLLGMAIPILAFLIYLNVVNAYDDFLDYSVFGVKTFSNKIPYLKLLTNKTYIIRILAIMVPVVLITAVIISIVNKFKRKDDCILYILTAYSIAMFSIVFPISDKEHFFTAMIPSWILSGYLLSLLFKNGEKFNFKYFIEFINIFTMLSTIALTLWIEYNHNEFLGRITKFKFQNHFDYVYIDNDVDKMISEIDDYIKKSEKKVYILDSSAAMYMIPIDRYNKDFDMFCKGNFGGSGEQKIIERIKNEDALYLILKYEGYLNWQNPNEVRKYIKENMELVESKEPFDVYKNKEILGTEEKTEDSN
ncbi:MAG: hypothetical protein IKE01_03180 [Clostridia bacterium]|nr:hypothetical protein [Clostridia bacterium]